MSENKYSTGDLFIAAMLGALVGAGVALLLAPKSGKETRDQLAGYLKESAEFAKKVPEALRQATATAKESLAAKGSPAIETEKKA